MARYTGTSPYARKRIYCARNKVWGFQVPFPKPWNAGGSPPSKPQPGRERYHRFPKRTGKVLYGRTVG